MPNYSQGFNYPEELKNAESLTREAVQSARLSWVIDLLLLASILAIFYFVGLGSYPLFTPDEGRYS